jgi:hypothetical protein
MTTPNLSFDRAEYSNAPAALSQCTWCGRGLANEWFHAADRPICAVCAANARELLPASSSRRFWSAVAWGATAAAGLTLALALAEHLLLALHFGFGYVLIAIPVGFYIGRTMRNASGGATGRKYQLAAALLTYIAVSIGSLTAFLWGATHLPAWLYLLLPLFPLVTLFTGHTALAGITILAAFVAIRWAWMQLAPHPLKITGPYRR